MNPTSVRALLLILLLVLLPTVAPAQTRVNICYNDPIPSGWIKVDFYTSFSTCGNPTGTAVTIWGNVWVIERYDNKAIGSSMAVCSDQATPSGWQNLGFSTTTGQCYDGKNFWNNNVKTIRRFA